MNDLQYETRNALLNAAMQWVYQENLIPNQEISKWCFL